MAITGQRCRISCQVVHTRACSEWFFYSRIFRYCPEEIWRKKSSDMLVLSVQVVINWELLKVWVIILKSTLMALCNMRVLHKMELDIYMREKTVLEISCLFIYSAYSPPSPAQRDSYMWYRRCFSNSRIQDSCMFEIVIKTACVPNHITDLSQLACLSNISLHAR